MRGVSQGRALALWIEGDVVTRRTEAVPGTAEGSGATPTHEVVTRTPYRVLMISEDSGRTFAGR